MSRILVACEFSGVVREAFSALGHEAFSCDILPPEDESPFHIQGDCLTFLDWGWDLMVAHPPCDFVCVSGMHWTTRGLRDPQLTKNAIEFAERLWAAPIPHICIENPVGVLSTRSKLGKPAQIVQPYEFGDDASKKTCLWLKGLPKLVLDPSRRFPGRMVTLPNGQTKERWSNQTNSGQNRLGPSDRRAQDRAKTYPGIAKAMAEQFSNL